MPLLLTATPQNSFSEAPELHRRQNSISAPRGVRAVTLPSPAHQSQSRHERRSVSIPVASPVKPAGVCGACASTATDVMLSCSHAMCSGCFTSSLNIVGEKPFSCPTCSERIQDFRFTSSAAKHVPERVKQSTFVPPVAVESTWDTASLHDSFEEVAPDQLAVLRLDDVPWVSVHLTLYYDLNCLWEQ